MLSIGKVGGGEGDPRYYIESVARGQEDYYSGHGEAQGEWAGRGAQARGLDGPIEEDDFIQTIVPPDDSQRSLLGFDLTFSAPKSVSVLYGVGDPEVARLTRDAHDRAVLEALDYVERHAAWTRRGSGGHRHVQADALTVATFRHRSSRAGDPQLHTHSVIVNEVTAEGRATALDGRALYAHGRTAGFLYQAALRHHLASSVGIEWGPVENGVAEIKGITTEVRNEFSRRSIEIREHMADRGGRSARSAQVAALETRRAKAYDVPLASMREQWQARAAEHGLGRDELHELLHGRAPGPSPPADVEALARSVASPHGVTRQSSVFDRRDVLREWAAGHRDGLPVADVEVLGDAWLRSSVAVRLDDGSHRPHLGGARYSTEEMLEVERRLLETATQRKDTGVAAVEPDHVAATTSARPFLSDEQAQLLADVTRSGDGVQVIRAAAGTGKTFALAVARDIWEKNDVPVYGVALAARAAVEMESLAGIDSCTIARFRQDLAHGYGLRHGSVLVVDEAGMVGSRALLELAEHAAETDSKLLLVGDDRQLPELDAGGAFRSLADAVGATELRQVRRQAHQWDREALGSLRDGRISDWAEAYRDRGRIVARSTAEEVRRALVDDWWEAARTDREDTIMIAHRRVDVGDLNELARARMHRDGRLSEEELVVGRNAFAVGDRVIARRNDRKLGLVNGTRAEVVAIDAEHLSLTIRTSPSTELTVDTPYLEAEHLAHGYALTAHAAQGATVDRAFVLGSDELYREWGYTALTRHREEARFYITSPGSAERALPGLEPEPDALTDDLLAMLHPSHRKRMAHDVGRDRAAPQPEPKELAETESAEARAQEASLLEQRDNLPRWRRGQRAELTRMATAQRDAALRWSEKAAALTESTAFAPVITREAQQDVPPQVARLELVAPCEPLVRRIGPRPPSVFERERWCRAAARLVETGDLNATLTRERGIADEFGIER